MDLPFWASVFDPHTKTNPKPLLLSPNPNPNKSWILVKNKV